MPRLGLNRSVLALRLFCLKNGVTKPVLERALEYWRNVDKGIGDRIAKAFSGN
jgi:hypothetical protein